MESEREIQLVRRTADGEIPPLFGPAVAEEVRAFHRSLPGYAPTPLVELRALAARLGLGALYVKDESQRFGLNAFKGLGGSWCLHRYLAEHPGKHTFVTATDGNHGRGIAWSAARLGMDSVVYMPKGSASERLENIRALGARAEITPWNYDDTVRYASRQAEEHGWVLVQDTSWEGYEQVPTWIMEGYTTLMLEAVEQMGADRPTHVLLQAGVGSMAGAAAGFLAGYYGADRPAIIVAEPHAANCFFQTAAARDGRLHGVGGELRSIMAGLACGEPCGLAWQVLAGCAESFLSLPDWVAAKGMRVLGNPVDGDPRIISGESGAATVGVVAEGMGNPARARLREQLGLDENSRVLCISTEGDTDRENYRRIVWDGAYPSLTKNP